MNKLKLDFLCSNNLFFVGDDETSYVLDLQTFINACFKNKCINEICFLKKDCRTLQFDLRFRNEMILLPAAVETANDVIVLAVIRRWDAHSGALPAQVCVLLFPSEKSLGISIGWIELTNANFGGKKAESLRKSIKSNEKFYAASKDNLLVAKKIIAYRDKRGKGRVNVQEYLFNVLCDFGAQADLQAPLDGLSTMTKAKGKSTLAVAYLNGDEIGSGSTKQSGTVQINKCKCVARVVYECCVVCSFSWRFF